MLFVHSWARAFRHAPLCVLAVFAGVLLGCSTLHAQTTGAILGTVSDQSGAVVVGANITLHNESSGDKRETKTNEVGRFTFAGVRPGSYSIEITAPNFKTWKRTGFELNASDTREVRDIRLEVGKTADVVQVEGTIAQVDLVSNGERSSVLASEQIDNLALVSRNVSELLKVLPGVATVAQNSGNGTSFDFSNSSPTGSPIGNGLSANGAPYRGGTMLLMDGSNVIDPGCNCWSTAVPNPEFTQEVKVQTSNFAADQPNGPVVFSTTSKSGGEKYHGSMYFTARNSALNSKSWQDKKKQDSAWYYPGATAGGPVPFTHNKLLVWGGFEYYWQKLPGTSLTAWVPTASMRAGNFSPTASDNAAVCSGAGGFSSSATNFCNDLSGTVLPNGSPLPAGAYDLGKYVGSGISQTSWNNMQALMKAYFPAPNTDPSAGYNWYMPINSQQNGYVYRMRADYNISDSTKLFLSYQLGNTTGFQAAHIWWNPGNSVPFPGGGMDNPTKARTASANFLHVFSPTLTNEMIVAWNKSTSPYVPKDISSAYRSTIGWTYKTVFGSGSNDLMAPNIYSAGSRSFPEMSQGNVFTHNGEFGLTKVIPSFQDNLSKVYKNHTFKGGFYYAMAGNYQVNFVRPNGVFNFGSLNTKDQGTKNLIDSVFYGSQNPMANLLMGVATNYSEDSRTDVFDMAYRTYSFYGMDDWKFNKRLTINVGLRFDHMGRWYERTGTGMAVWLPRLYEDDVNAKRSNPGVRWHGIDPGIPLSGSQSTVLFASPRFGFAYDLFGTGKTVIRGGWGMYRWNDQYNDYSGYLSTAQGLNTYGLPNGKSVLVSQIDPQLLSYSSSTGSTVSGAIYAADPTDHAVPVTKAYNLTISQQLPWRSLLEIAYVGNTSDNLLMGGQSDSSGIAGGDFININKIARGALFGKDPVTGAARPANLETTDKVGNWDYTHYFPYYKGYGTSFIRVGEHVGDSNYNALQVAWVKQGHGLTFNLNYNYSKALGIVAATVDPFSVHGNYGVLNIDRPHVINMSYSYEVGNRYKGNKILAGAINGWMLSGITTWQSGANLQSAIASQNLGLSLQNDSGAGLTTKSYYGTNVGMILPVYTCDPGSGLSSHQYINLSCVSAPAVGQYGDRQAPYLSGPAYFNQDFAMRKSFNLTERQKVEFRLSASNFFNHPLYYVNGGNMGTLLLQQNGSSWKLADGNNKTYGTAVSKTGDRKLSLGVKYTF